MIVIGGPMKLKRDSQVGGDHYAKLAVQPTYYALANGLGVCEANVVKYVSRWKSKGGLNDLRKAREYLEILIEWEMENE
jgi:hypothetical protein